MYLLCNKPYRLCNRRTRAPSIADSKNNANDQLFQTQKYCLIELLFH